MLILQWICFIMLRLVGYFLSIFVLILSEGFIRFIHRNNLICFC